VGLMEVSLLQDGNGITDNPHLSICNIVACVGFLQTVPSEVRLQELIAQKDARIGQLEADNQRQSQEIKLLKEKVDLLIRRLFGTTSEQLGVAEPELLLKEAESGKADASAEKAEASPIVDTKLTSAAIEAVNGIVQLAKRMARGFKNFVYFKTAAYHRAGQLKLAVPTIT
jgi:Transposase/Transposase C of IS166 homeodomain